MKITTSLVALVAAGITLTACALPDASSKDALPQALPSSPTKAPGAEPIVPPEEDRDVLPVANTCDIAREAFLTGTASDIRAALKALKADRTADATAREYAGYYLGRDKNDRSLREMDQSLISTACSV